MHTIKFPFMVFDEIHLLIINLSPAFLSERDQRNPPKIQPLLAHRVQTEKKMTRHLFSSHFADMNLLMWVEVLNARGSDAIGCKKDNMSLQVLELFTA